MSQLFAWDDKYDVGVDRMNDEHKQIIALMNQVYDQNGAGAPKSVLLRTLKALGRCAADHFADEEAHMQRVGFPEFTKHKHIHESLLQRVRDYVAEFEAGGDRVSQEFFSFLKLWLSSHILHVDTKYGQCA